MKRNGFDIFIWVITIVLIGVIFFMPDTVPIHWNHKWQIDSYGSRYNLLILAVMPILIYYGMLLTKKIDPRRENIEKRLQTYNIFRYGLTCFFICLVIFFYYLSLYPQMNPKRFIIILLALVLIGMGNYMPKIPQNYFLGIKTPWTLANEYVWKKTHKVGGYSWMLIGIVIGLYGLFDLPYEYVVMIVLLVADVIFMMVYSYTIYRRTHTKNIDY